MAIIYNFLKNVWNNLLNESKTNISFLPLILLMVTIPLPLGINNIFLVLFVLTAILNKNKRNLSFSWLYILPIVLFVWMGLSYFWSIDTARTLNAIPKEIGLLLLPVVFLWIPYSNQQKDKAISVYSYTMVLYVVYYLLRAVVRYIITQDSNVFFYHGEYEDDFGLVPKMLNAIHFSVFVSIAFFYFLTHEVKTKINLFITFLLFGFIVLLSSKNIILVVVALIILYFLFYSKIANKMRLRNLMVMVFIIGLIFSFGKIKERFLTEFQQNTAKSLSDNVIKKSVQNVHNISIYEAWNNEKFYPNAFFPGTAFRVYQARIFLELLQEEPIFWKGFGLNATLKKTEEKGKKYNVFLGDEITEGYQKKNFHNQYIQNFVDLGVVGFFLLLLMVILNIKNALKSKDFIHIAFSILMISLFLTESFLWRQRGVIFFMVFYCLFNISAQFKIERK
ncbi:O-antigen ligase family protein [Flavobacterium channae]|uniref:O-antigen ligase family protein n=1 Tax=Flavobacterium channae TaxID=2897181 RepID=UPI001E4F1692|nr:O-antigen ligase family protein [Flavobacterium channae]UGS23637.1 O-antigen ligase family protein [Flavobacterium channae]